MTAHPRRPRRSHFRVHFLRSLRPSDASVAIAMDLDRQLDAWVTGTPAPPSQISSATDEHAQLAGLTNAFQQMATMDATTRERTESSTAHAKAIIWEDIMFATTAIPSSSRPSDTSEEPTWARQHVEKSLPRAARSANSTLPRRPSRWLPTLSPVLNVAMVALMLFTLGLGAFTITGGSDRWGFGGNGGDPGPGGVNGLASLPAGEQGTPVAQVSLPTADECTVTPLTVDQVMARIKGETSSTASSSPTTFNATPGPTSDEATPTPTEPQRPSEEMLQQISIAHREFIACLLKGDQFQVWALVHPESVFWREFVNSYPPFTDEATVRQDLEALASGNPNPASRLPNVTNMLSVEMALPLVNPDPNASVLKYNFMTDAGPDQLALVEMIYHYPDGSSQAIPRSDMALTWAYSWNRDTDSWMVITIGIDKYRG